MADELDVDAMIQRFRDRAAAVRQRNLPPVAGPERTKFVQQAQADFQDFASYSAPLLRDSLDRTLTYDFLGRSVADHRWGINGRVLGHSFVYDSLGQLLLVRSTLDSACSDPQDTLVQNKLLFVH